MNFHTTKKLWLQLLKIEQDKETLLCSTYTLLCSLVYILQIYILLQTKKNTSMQVDIL